MKIIIIIIIIIIDNNNNNNNNNNPSVGVEKSGKGLLLMFTRHLVVTRGLPGVAGDLSELQEADVLGLFCNNTDTGRGY